MRNDEKLMEVEGEREQLIGEKLRRVVLVGRREGNSTPPPNWKFGLVQPDGTLIQEFDFASNSKTLSARKLGANLWEMQPQIDDTVAKMSKVGRILGNQKVENVLSKELSEAPVGIGNASEQPASCINLGKQVAASPTQHNVIVKKVRQLQQPLSPASYCSSIEAPLHRPVTSSLVCKGKDGESSHSVKTSTELLKVLNRIWSLEEKHALDMSLVKMLRRELDQSQARIQELLQEKKRDQADIDKLTKRIMEYKVARRKERDQFKDAVKLLEDKVEGEIHVRLNSEKLHHKLAKDLSDLKSLFSNALRELERERKARTLLEDLCDELAKGIRDYEQEVRSVKHKYQKTQIGREGDDRLILHISEAWLDERAQRKLADAAHDISAKQSDLDKLCFEIEGFLQAKQSGNSDKNDSPPLKNQSQRDKHGNSMESFHLNDNPASASQMARLKQTRGFVRQQAEGTSDKAKSKMVQPNNSSDVSSSSMQLDTTRRNEDDVSAKSTPYQATANLRLPRKAELMQRSSQERKDQAFDTDTDFQDDQSQRYKNRCRGGSCNPSIFTGPSSPVKKWDSNVPTTDQDTSETSSRWQRSVKTNTLMAKLMEARQEGARDLPKLVRHPQSAEDVN